MGGRTLFIRGHLVKMGRTLFIRGYLVKRMEGGPFFIREYSAKRVGEDPLH